MKNRFKQNIFRGQHHGCWVEGYHVYCPHSGHHEIVSQNTARSLTEVGVDPKTIGQFVREIKGMRIFEGDVVKTRHQEKATVEWMEEYDCFVTRTIDEIVKDEIQFNLGDIQKILGNVTDNPKLLES